MSHFKEKKQAIEQFCASSHVASWTMNEVIKNYVYKESNNFNMHILHEQLMRMK
jgi:hypothetical protein